MIDRSQIRTNVVERAGSCRFCGNDPETTDVTRTESREYDEVYYGINCPNCPAQYDDDGREWWTPTPPGEDTPRISVL